MKRELVFNPSEADFSDWVSGDCEIGVGEPDGESKLIADSSFGIILNGKPHESIGSVRSILNEKPKQLKSRGIYFLCRENLVYYIGSSQNVLKRLRCHHVASPGDLVIFIPCDAAELLYMESYCIGLWRPPGNFGGDSRILVERNRRGNDT